MARNPWIPRLLALGFGVGLLGAAELGLRVVGVSPGPTWSPPRLVYVVENGAVQGEFEMRATPHFVREALPDGREGARTAPEYQLGKGGGFPVGGCMRDEHFATAPAAGTRRYVLLGGSAAMGQNPVGGRVRRTWDVEKMANGVTALPDALAISGQLEQQLAAAGHPAEVINAGMIAQDSGGVRTIAEEALAWAPDALVLYLGNNEGIGLSYAMKGLEVPTLRPVQGALHGLRLYRVLADMLLPARQRAAAAAGPAQRVNGIRPEVLGRITMAQWQSAGGPLMGATEPSDEVYQAVLARFDGNLRAIVSAAADRGVATYIIPTPPHLTYPPFFDANSPGLDDRDIRAHTEARERARAALQTGDARGALRFAEDAIDADPANASAWYFKGMALDQLAQPDDAVDALLRAHALDISRKRTQPAFARIAAQVCADLGCRTADAHRPLADRARTEGVGVYDVIFGDHEHLNPDGNAWVAGMFTDLILEAPP